MEKLYRYLEKIGLKESTSRNHYRDEAPALFYRETYGDNSYFTNAPNFIYPGAVVILDYNTSAPADYYRKQKQLEKMILKYCKRYNYEIKSRYFYGEQVMTITTCADQEAANNYYFFRDRCRQECEQEAHRLYTEGKPEEVNARMGEIMTEHGNYYNLFLQESNKATA